MHPGKIRRTVALLTLLAQPAIARADADLILRGGRILTVDAGFRIAEALAIGERRVLEVGTDEEIDAMRGPETRVVDLAGRTVIPGLIDSHVHAPSAAMTEFEHPVPAMDSIADVLAYVRSRASELARGEWILVRQVFITRLREQRYPTRQELDEAAPDHPVLFSTGPDASLNSLALELSGIDGNFVANDGGAGYVEKDPETGEPTGILRNCTRFVKYRRPGREATETDRLRRLEKLLRDYNSVGITSILDRNASAESMKLYRTLLESGRLTVRVAASRSLDTLGPVDELEARIRSIAAEPLRRGGPMLRIIGVKVFLDGGMLTGSAYMLKPWGVSRIYSIDDPEYRGLLFIPRERLLRLVRATVAEGMQFTAHSVGDGAVHTLLDAYEEVNETLPVASTRPCITHSNFMSAEAVRRAAALGVCVDIQPAWLYLDTRTLVRQFGYDRLRYFQPLRSIFEAGGVAGGGSDHMQKIGSLRSVNPYDPFLGMWVTLTRRARWYHGALHPEEALDRDQALRFYTSQNARILRAERDIGSIEKGKLADLAVLDTDILTCPVDAVRTTKVIATYLGGELVYSATARE